MSAILTWQPLEGLVRVSHSELGQILSLGKGQSFEFSQYLSQSANWVGKGQSSEPVLHHSLQSTSG